MTETRSSRLSDPRRVIRRSFEVFIVALVAMVTTFLLVFAASLYEAGQANAIDKAAALEQYVRRSLAVSTVVATEALDHLEKRGSVEGIASDYDAHLEFARLVASANLSEGMIFVDREGVVVVHSGSFPASPIDLSDRAWFQAHLAGAAERVNDFETSGF